MTGERSSALPLPMRASIAAHYTAADGRPATCPRLIMLDELFAGVDPTNRSQLFARFTDWDLDAVFTEGALQPYKSRLGLTSPGDLYLKQIGRASCRERV